MACLDDVIHLFCERHSNQLVLLALSISRHLMLTELNKGAYQVQSDDSRSTYGNRVCKILCYVLFLLNALVREQQSSVKTLLALF